MDYYINRDKLIKRRNGCNRDCSKCDFVEDGDSWCEGELYVIDVLRQPAADVRPVVRGHKVTHNRPIAGYWVSGKLDCGWDGMEGRVWVEPIMNNPVDYCSECGKRLDDTFQNYCPNCGAKMK